MFLLKEKRKHGTNLCIVQSYRDPATKASKTKRILNLGYLEDLRKQYDDPVAHFQEVAKKMSEEKSAETKKIKVGLDPAKPMSFDENLVKNYGYISLSALYHELKLDVFFGDKQRSWDIGYNLNSVMKLLVYGRILFPGHEKQIYEKKERFFDKMEFSLDDVYNSFTYIHRYKSQLQAWIHQRICENYGRETDQMYYYMTNHYFEAAEQDRYRKDGAAKEQRQDPIVQMGLLVDKNGLPAYYDLFPRNKEDEFALSPASQKTCKDLGVGKLIIVTDIGLSSAESLYRILAEGNGYIVCQSIRSAKKEIQNFVLSKEGYTQLDEGCKVKSRIYKREFHITTAGGIKKTIAFNEKQIVFHNEKYERCIRGEREDVLIKAKDLIAHPGKYSKASAQGIATFVKNIEYNKRTGAILQDKQVLYLDEERLKEEEKFDGYYMFLTSQTDENIEDVIEIYDSLWKIEEAFKVINSNFSPRPASIPRAEHLYAHFSTCFVALVLTRILEMKMQKAYPLDRVLQSLRKCNYVHIEGNNYIQSYYDAVLDVVGRSTGIDFSKRYGTLSKIKENIGATKKRS